jgi:hypothetical protein
VELSRVLSKAGHDIMLCQLAAGHAISWTNHSLAYLEDALGEGLHGKAGTAENTSRVVITSLDSSSGQT